MFTYTFSTVGDYAILVLILLAVVSGLYAFFAYVVLPAFAGKNSNTMLSPVSTNLNGIYGEDVVVEVEVEPELIHNKPKRKPRRSRKPNTGNKIDKQVAKKVQTQVQAPTQKQPQKTPSKRKNTTNK